MMFDPRLFNREDVTTWPPFRPPLIAHDVGRSHDRSTAVVGGNCLFGPRLLGIAESIELPQGLFGHPRANALAAIDRRYYNDSLIFADLSNDETYAEVLHETFGPRVIGLHISRSGDGMRAERRQVNRGSMLVYTVGRSYLLELLYRELQVRQVRWARTPESQRAIDQLLALQTETRESGRVHQCLPGKHDDLAISWAMLNWAARHQHLPYWIRPIEDAHRPRVRRQTFGWGSFV